MSLEYARLMRDRAITLQYITGDPLFNNPQLEPSAQTIGVDGVATDDPLKIAHFVMSPRTALGTPTVGFAVAFVAMAATTFTVRPWRLVYSSEGHLWMRGDEMEDVSSYDQLVTNDLNACPIYFQLGGIDEGAVRIFFSEL